MALKSTIFKATLQIADMDRGYYGDVDLTLARHPSETDERMMVRLLAFALHADTNLQFTKGLCADDEPDLWQKSLTDDIELWVDVGLPDSDRIRKACQRAQRVRVYVYGGKAAGIWWSNTADKLSRFDNLSVLRLPQTATQALADRVQRTMNLQCTIQEGQVWLSDAETAVLVEPECLYPFTRGE